MNLNVNSVPPAKSIPSRKPPPGRAIEMMPGMMTISEMRKNQLRRLTKSSFLTRGSGRDSSLAGSTLTSSDSASAAGASTSSDDSSTIHP